MSVELSRELLEVETLLRRAADTLAYPPTPPLSVAVRARLHERRSLAGRATAALAPLRAPSFARAAFALLAVAAIALGASLAVPVSRSALADFFHLSHVRVERAPTAGPTPPALSPQSFAKPSTVEKAQRLIDFPLRFPTSDGDRLQPDAVYVQGLSPDLPIVIFVYEGGDYDLYQTKSGYFNKGGLDSSDFHEISFGGHGAYWIDRGGHIASFLDEQGRVMVESRRSVDRATLLWEENGITYRLETGLAQADAIRVAESLR